MEVARRQEQCEASGRTRAQDFESLGSAAADRFEQPNRLGSLKCVEYPSGTTHWWCVEQSHCFPMTMIT